MRFKRPNNIFRVVLFLASLESLVVAILLFLDKSKDGGMLFGLSRSKIGLVAGLLIVAALFSMIGTNWGKNKKSSHRIESYVESHVGGLAFVFYWGFVALLIIQNEDYFYILTSGIRSVDIPNFFAGIRPIVVLGALLFFEFCCALYIGFRKKIKSEDRQSQLIFIWFARSVEDLFHNEGWTSLGKKTKEFVAEIKPGVFVWLGMLLVWVGIAVSRIGIIPDDRYWNIAGVPILPYQIVLIILFMVLCSDVYQLFLKTGNDGVGRKIDQTKLGYAVMFLVWVGAVVIWNSQELNHTYFAPGPYEPNLERYPFSDAADFDIGSQYFLLGKGLNNGGLTDRPFLMMFFALLHFVGGQEYEWLALGQIFFVALIPVLLFLLGWRLHSKIAGIGMALLGIFKEANAISTATKVSLANPKVLTSEMLTSLLLIGFTMIIMIWFDHRRSKTLWPMLAGGILGIAIGVRVNTLFLILVVILISWIAYREERIEGSGWIKNVGLFLLAVVIMIGPYSVENIKTDGTPFWLLKISQVYERSHDESGRFGLPQNIDKKLIRPDHMPERSNRWGGLGVFSRLPAGLNQFAAATNFWSLTARHFVHNEIMSMLSYPTSYRVASMDDWVEKPFWDENVDWEGALAGSEILVIGFNLLIISVGIGFSYRRWKISGLAPLLVHLSYNLTNAGARTSGGRYLVPVDWVLHIYFILGLASIYVLVRNWEASSQVGRTKVSLESKRKSFMLLTGILLLMGSSFIFSNVIGPDPLFLNGRKGLVNLEKSDFRYKGTPNTYRDVKRFLKTDSGTLMTGFILYPRLFGPEEKFEKYFPDPRMESGSLLYFRLLTEMGPKHILIQDSETWRNGFPNAETAVVIGCNRGAYIEAKIISILEDGGSNLAYSSPSELGCDQELIDISKND